MGVVEPVVESVGTQSRCAHGAAGVAGREGWRGGGEDDVE